MRRIMLDQYTPSQLLHLCRPVAFFRHLAQADMAQFALLMRHSCLMELEAGEVLIEKDTVGERFYSLLAGQLAIFPEKRQADTAINELSAGTIVGALSMLNRQPRTATVAVSSMDGAKVLATDFSVFGELEDMGRVSLACKLQFFREVAGHIYRMLKEYQYQVSDDLIREELCTLMSFEGRRNSLDELEYLTEFASALAWLLNCCNSRIEPKVRMFSESRLESRLARRLKLPQRPLVRR